MPHTVTEIQNELPLNFDWKIFHNSLRVSPSGVVSGPGGCTNEMLRVWGWSGRLGRSGARDASAELRAFPFWLKTGPVEFSSAVFAFFLRIATSRRRHLDALLFREAGAVSNNGSPCEGYLREIEPCGVQPWTPIACRMSQWSDWWVEGIECPTSLRDRSRFILESASSGGEGCLGILQETEAYTDGCPAFVPVTCDVGDWSD